MFQWIKRKVRDTKFRLFGHEKALQQIFEMSRSDGMPSQLDFSTKKFRALLEACGVCIDPRGAADGWDLHFQGKTKRIDGPQVNNVNITTIQDVKDLLVCAGVQEPSMIYKHLPGA